MFEGRSIPIASGVEDIEDAEYSLSDNETTSTPFDVAVLSMGNVFVGYGRVLGKITENGWELTIVGLDDPDAPGGVVHLIAGIECQWERSTEALRKVIAEKISEGYPVVGPADYAGALDRSYGSVNN